MITLNGKPVEFSVYPNGETKLELGRHFSCQAYYIGFRYESDQDLIRLMMVKRHLEPSEKLCHLFIDYMPYSRMDRTEDGYPGFTLRYVAEFINWLDFDTVSVFEPHSDVTTALLDRASAFYPTKAYLPDVMELIEFDPKLDIVFYPDAGAQKRYADLKGFPHAVGFKHRDFATGKLNGEMEILGLENGVRKVLILDDLCSRGGTFIMAAKALGELGVQEIYLFVAHCEDTMWEGDLLHEIDGLYCTDSILSVKMPQFGLRPLGRKVNVYSKGEWL